MKCLVTPTSLAIAAFLATAAPSRVGAQNPDTAPARTSVEPARQEPSSAPVEASQPASPPPQPYPPAAAPPQANPPPAMAPQPAASQPYSPQPTAPQPYSPQPAASQPYSPQPTAPQPYSQSGRDEEEEPHHGFFARLTLGAGMGYLGKGDLGPKPGFKPIRPLSHTSPVVGIAGQLGGGGKNFAIAGELLFEKMLQSIDAPSTVDFWLLGAGITGSYYLDYDFYLTGHLRAMGLFVWMGDVPCFVNRMDTLWGPGVGLTIGKEWFRRRERDREPPTDTSDGTQPQDGRRRTRSHGGIGIALQANYARLGGTPQLDYVSGLLLFSLSHF